MQSAWFRAKMVALALLLLNVALHPRLGTLPDARRRASAAVSLAGWPLVLLFGRMIGYA